MAGLGDAFRILGANKLNAARMDVLRQKIAQQEALRNSEVRFNDSRSSLNQAQLGGMNSVYGSLVGAGADTNAAEVQANLLLANRGANPNSVFEGAGRAFALNGIGDQMRAAKASGEPIYKVSNGVEYNQYEPGTTTTQVGDAMINAKNAAAAKARSGIGADKSSNYVVMPDASGHLNRINKLTGEVTPLTQNGQPVTAKGTDTLPSPTALSGWAKNAFPDAIDGNGDVSPALLGDLSQRAAAGEKLGHIFANAPVEVTKPDGSIGWYDATLDAAQNHPSVAAMANGTTMQPAAGGGGIARPTTAAAYAALPSGATYIDPGDGKVHRKR